MDSHRRQPVEGNAQPIHNPFRIANLSYIHYRWLTHTAIIERCSLYLFIASLSQIATPTASVIASGAKQSHKRSVRNDE